MKKSQNEDYTKVTVVLLERQICWLHSVIGTIREKNKVVVSRSEILRALIDALEESGVDLTSVGCEADIKDILLKTLNKDDFVDICLAAVLEFKES